MRPGAAALARVEARFAHHILRAWDDQRTSLRPSLEAALGVAPANDLSVRPPVGSRPTRDAADPTSAGPARPDAPGVVSSPS
jgi:hypothetical protein